MIIRILKDLNINISWNMIFIGLCTGDVEAYEVIDYAMEQIELGDCRSEIFELQDLQEDFIDEAIERRKIRLAIVYDVIKEKNHNFVDGLIQLTELWDKLDYPKDSPHTVQGRNNKISPNEYYTQENYDKLYKANCEWFRKELLYLQNK